MSPRHTAWTNWLTISAAEKIAPGSRDQNLATSESSRTLSTTWSMMNVVNAKQRAVNCPELKIPIQGRARDQGRRHPDRLCPKRVPTRDPVVQVGTDLIFVHTRSFNGDSRVNPLFRMKTDRFMKQTWACLWRTCPRYAQWIPIVSPSFYSPYTLRRSLCRRRELIRASRRQLQNVQNSCVWNVDQGLALPMGVASLMARPGTAWPATART